MMRVADFQRHLKGLVEMLAEGGGKAPAAELGSLCAELEPFRELGLTEFADVLRRAAEAGEPLKPAAKIRSKPAKNPELVKAALEEVHDLYEKALDPDALRHDAIREAVARWDKELSKEEGLEVARTFLIGESNYPSKIAALEAVGRKIADRLTAQKRIGNLDRTRSPVAPTEAEPIPPPAS